MTDPEFDEDLEPEEDVCGETYDHTTQEVYEDSEVVQWVCTRCGAEGFEDKEQEEEPDGADEPPA